KEGKIRLNRKGNPEYWVPSKKGQIIDTNWLDISGMELVNQELTISKECLDRLFKLCLIKEKRIFAILSDNKALKSIAKKYRLNFVDVFLDKEDNNMEVPSRFNLVFDRYTENKNESEKYYSFLKENGRYEGSNPLNHILLDIENFYPIVSTPKKDYNLLIKGDNLVLFSYLIQNFSAKFKLVYIDPPFFTGIHENIVVPLKSKAHGLTYPIRDQAYENVSLTADQIKHFEIWFGKRAKWIKRMLREDGLLFVRFDYHFGHYAKMILDQLFGPENFINEFIVRRMKKNLSKRNINRQQHLIVHFDSLFAYRASKKARLCTEVVRKVSRKNQDKAEREYKDDNIWVDIAGYEKVKKTLYPTENSEALLKRVISISTEEGDLVGDFFAGSGTTLAIAEEMNRKWVGVDIGLRSVHEIKKRILRIGNFQPFKYMELFEEKKTNSIFIPVQKVETLEEDVYRFLLLENAIGLYISVIIKVDSLNSLINVKLENIWSVSGKNNEKYDFAISELVDYWGVDWDCKGNMLNIGWSSIRKLRGRRVAKNAVLEAKHNLKHKYHQMTLGVLVVDIYGVSYRMKIMIPP
ncbi:MAG: DNA methyltransferase, partial [Candidatus Hodarchaeales archaeon]